MDVGFDFYWEVTWEQNPTEEICAYVNIKPEKIMHLMRSVINMSINTPKVLRRTWLASYMYGGKKTFVQNFNPKTQGIYDTYV